MCVSGLYNMTMTGGLGLLSISTEGDQEWSAEISNITHTIRLSLQADCGDAGQVLSSSLDYEDTRLDMEGLDSSANLVLERAMRVALSTANLSMETLLSSWVSGVLESILC